ncbi:GNAT family N-acetyltransferase [Nitratireductor mangrovi]|uniref:GNAT family N-acetyltransferase n=1 Tax=Nitratireductor mangrovi TaxID=2599600 RepID=A0A5B8KWA9_9HYPH|nr:GNAT family N-acetyltransferase [Nitratireductor mangrovi]QDY99894.1 GNAT family N-acetyltransferase [Nitratireductor mangrovi]
MHVLLTSRLTLRPPALPDAEDIALWLNNWNVARMLGPVPFPYWAADAEDWIAGLADRPHGLVYTIHRERLIGVVSLEGDAGEPRLGYWLGEAWHGHGFMTEAAGALIAHAFATRGIHAISSSVFADNPASMRVQEKLGFVVSGARQTWSRSRQAQVPTWTTRLTATAFARTMETERKAAA